MRFVLEGRQRTEATDVVQRLRRRLETSLE